MAIKFDKTEASRLLEKAVGLARGEDRVPVVWTSHARSVFDLQAKTWTPALGTLLLARALNDTIDSMSIKTDPQNPRSYSMRGLCHSVLVPSSFRHRFSIRNTGREPLNNQPWFRYDRIDGIERTKSPEDRDYFVEIAAEVGKLNSADAFRALAAFLREAIDQFDAIHGVQANGSRLSLDGLNRATDDFLRLDAPERPKRLQAFAAACLDLVFDEVRTRRLNDPSRDFPGDVQAILDGSVAVAVEVRGKPVEASDIANFVAACEAAGIGRAVVFVDAAPTKESEVGEVLSDLMRRGRLTQAVVFATSRRLLEDALLWSPRPSAGVIAKFVDNFLTRLRDIEVSVLTLNEWKRAVAVA